MTLLNDAQKADLKSKLQKLQDQYAKSIPEKLAEISIAWDKYLTQKDDESIRHLINCTHKLAGTAKTYGFATVGTLASDAEDELIALQEQAPQERKIPASFQAIEKLIKYQTT